MTSTMMPPPNGSAQNTPEMPPPSVKAADRRGMYARPSGPGAKREGKRGALVIFGVGAAFVLLLVYAVVFPNGGPRKTTQIADTAVTNTRQVQPASANVDGTNNDTSTVTTTTASPNPHATVQIGSSTDPTSALDAELAKAPDHRCYDVDEKPTGVAGCVSASGLPCFTPAGQPTGNCPVTNVGSPATTMTNETNNTNETNKTSTVGNEVTTSGGDHPASATSPPLTPAQEAALERHRAILAARERSLSTLGASASPDVQPRQAIPKYGDVVSQVEQTMGIRVPQIAYGAPVASTDLTTMSAWSAQATPTPQPSSSDDLVMRYDRKPAPTEFTLNAGSSALIVLDRAINTDAKAGMLVCHFARDVMDSGKHGVVIPHDTSCIGEYKADDSRIECDVHYLIFPDGSYLALNGAYGSDLDGAAGFTPSSVNDHRGKVLSAAGITAALSAIPVMLTSNASTGQVGVTPLQALGGAVSTNIASAGSKIVEARASLPVTLIADPRVAYTITFTRSIPFSEPYAPMAPAKGLP